MVANCKKLFDRRSVSGTLHFVIDGDSKFAIRFYNSLKLEVEVDRKSSKTLVSPVPPKRKNRKAEKILTVINGSLQPLNLSSVESIDSNDRTGIKSTERLQQEIANLKSGFQVIPSGLNEIDPGVEALIKSENEQNGNEESASMETSQNLDNDDNDDASEPETITKKSLSYCTVCCKTFKNKRELVAHKKVDLTSEYRCDKCCEVFPFQSFLDIHTQAHHSTSGAKVVFSDDRYWYSCEQCGTLAKDLISLQMHSLTHTGEGYFQCCQCFQQFGEIAQLTKHLKTHFHWQRGNIRCRWCNKWFPTRADLGKHKLVCREIKCHFCNRLFPNKTSRHVHYNNYHPQEVLRCELCPLLFSSQEDLEQHKVMHTKNKKKQCTLCGLFFSRLKKHMVKHKKVDIPEDEMFHCDKCPAKFTSKTTFTRHCAGHNDDKPYSCPHCPKTFAVCGNLRNHLLRHNTSVLLPNVCEVCGQDCETPEQLKAHMLTHPKTCDQFPCSLCKQTFSYRKTLDAHIQAKHPETTGLPMTTIATTTTHTTIIPPENYMFTEPFVDASRQLSEMTAIETLQQLGAATSAGLVEVLVPGLSDMVQVQSHDPNYAVYMMKN